MKIYHSIFLAKISFQDALKDGNVVVATLCNLFDDDSHSVLIYKFENYKFKVKDSHGEKYEIPIDRPDSIQVCKKEFQIYHKLGKNHATGRTGIQ